MDLKIKSNTSSPVTERNVLMSGKSQGSRKLSLTLEKYKIEENGPNVSKMTSGLIEMQTPQFQAGYLEKIEKNQKFSIDIEKLNQPPKRQNRMSPQFKEYKKYISMKKQLKTNYDQLFEEMSARESKCLIDNQSKWAFLYKRMQFNTSFSRLKRHIQAVHIEKDQPKQQLKQKKLEEYFAKELKKRND